MKAILPALALVSIGCSAAVDDAPIVIDSGCSACGGKSDEIGAATTVSAPSLVCHVVPGSDTDEFYRQDAVECLVSAEPGFRLNWASVQTQSPEQLAESTLMASDALTTVASLVGNKYPMSLKLHVNYVMAAVTPDVGDPAEVSGDFECTGDIASPSDTVECTRSFENWTVELVPDDALQAEWDAGQHRAASFEVRTTPTEGTGTRWQQMVRKGEPLARTLSIVLDPMSTTATLTANVPYNAETTPVPVTEPTRFILRPGGIVTPESTEQP